MEKNDPVINFANLLLPANFFRVVCVDERTVKEKNRTNPVKLPGATYAVVDALKTLYRYTEESAWKIIQEARVPIATHLDDHFDPSMEVVGCGYAKLVETQPQSVFAVEAVKTAERLTVVSQFGGEILHYLGHHTAKYAVINRRQGFSLDQNKLPTLGIFSCDTWAAKYYAVFLKQIDPQINPDEFQDHIEKVFRATVETLTSKKISDFVIIE